MLKRLYQKYTIHEVRFGPINDHSNLSIVFSNRNIVFVNCLKSESIVRKLL